MTVLAIRRIGPFPAEWLWTTDDICSAEPSPAGTIPAGVVLDHGDHNAVVAWAPVVVAGEVAEPFTLEALVPLTIGEPLPCPHCGVTGRIEQGRWVPVEGGQGG